MSIRRSKRVTSMTDLEVSSSVDIDVPASKRRRKILVCETDSKGKNRSTSQTKVENDHSKPGVSSRRPTRSVKNTKSSYFESPVASEESSSEDTQVSRSVRRNRKSNTRGCTKTIESKFVESSDTSEEYDSEDEVSKPTRKRKQNMLVTKNSMAKKRLPPNKAKSDDSSGDEFVSTKLTLNSSGEKLTQLKGFESESGSSSDEDPKLDCKTPPNQSSSLIDPLESDTEIPVDTKPTEFFDFTAIVSQMSQANPDEKKEGKEKLNTKEIVVEKSEPVPTTSAKKNSRGKKTTVVKEKSTPKKEKLEVFELLAMGEKTDMSAKDIKESVSKARDEYEIPKQVEIVFDTPLLKKKKKCDDLEMALKRRLNNIRRENQVYIHKVHVLCWISHGIYLNRLLNSADVLACALSLVPNEHLYPPKRMRIEHLELLIKFFTKKVELVKNPEEHKQKNLVISLQRQFEQKKANSKIDLCFMFICIIRALGIKCRLIVNLNVVPLKPNSDQLLPVTQKKEDSTVKAGTSANVEPQKKEIQEVNNSAKTKSNKPENRIEKNKRASKSKDTKKQTISEKDARQSKSVEKQKSSQDEKKKARQSSPATHSKSGTDGKKLDGDDKNGFSKSKQKVNEKRTKKKIEENRSGPDQKDIRRSSRLGNSKSKYFTEEVSSDEDDEEPKSKSNQSSVKKQKAIKAKRSDTNNSMVEEMSTSDSEDSANEFRSPKKKKSSRKVLSTDEENEIVEEKGETKSDKKPAKKMNHWLEVYLEEEEKWFSVDIGNKKFHCDEELSKNASTPIRYVLAFNNDQTIKDVTRRYAHQFLSVTRKLRTDEEWWTRTMAAFKPISTPREREEDEELDKKLEDQPIPKTISEYKNHPLYALQRHLLKFQAIYPQDAVPVGFIKIKDNVNEPVYRRACVHQLHGREMWIKEAKVVKLNEKPYKIVKGRQKKDKFGTGEGPRDLELFGLWQVEDYVPPTAENGRVPRNAFGNVELFKMSMLPKGTVYLQIPGLQRIANKLNIDCAAAITGFEYSTNGWSYPVKDGFVVCEEFKDILLDAFNQEVEEAEKKERQKREERISSNWKRLIRAMFIAEKLKRKYNFGEPSSSKSNTEKTANKKFEAKAKK